MEQKIKVGIDGITGYTGIELLRWLSNHPYVELSSFSSYSNKGKLLKEALPFSNLNYKYIVIGEFVEGVDLVFLALPHEVSLERAVFYLKKGIKVIDLSGAYRLKNKELYKEYYGFTHNEEQEFFLEKAVYGLPELFRDKIRASEFVSNPGCYPTATILGAYPLIKAFKPKAVFVDAISGVSGAGRKLSQKFHFPEMTENAFYYSVKNHRHVPEMEEYLGLQVKFSPCVIPSSRGMIANIKIFNIESSQEDIFTLFSEFYKDEPFVKIINEPPQIKWVSGTNNCLIFPYYDKRTKTIEVISAIDNLGKGASSQAIQNMNIMFGFEETAGLINEPFFP